MKSILLLSTLMLGVPSFAQRPAPPPEGDVAPAPLPMEGKKTLDPPVPHGREKPTTRKALPRPPVKPPTPEPSKVDPIQ